jgi:hypothetical protein
LQDYSIRSEKKSFFLYLVKHNQQTLNLLKLKTFALHKIEAFGTML